jgi:hypothetical protein
MSLAKTSYGNVALKSMSYSSELLGLIGTRRQIVRAEKLLA